MLRCAPVVCVVGATATGKSSLAELIAGAIEGEIINADSMQIYRGMDIGTAKVNPKDRSVPYHCIDIVDPGDVFSASLYQDLSREAFKDIDHRLKRSVLVGGTGFYIRSAIDDYCFPKGEQIDNPERIQWKNYLDEHGAHALWKELHLRDPESAAIIHENDSKRVMRAFELLSQGLKYSEQREALAHISQAIPAVFIGLDVSRPVLHERINYRVDKMREEGLVNEVRGLVNKGFREGITSIQAIGYKEIIDAFDGKLTIDEAFTKIKTSTRRYAKRQCTWFRKDARIHWIKCDNRSEMDIFEEAMRIVKNGQNTDSLNNQ